MVTSKLLLDVLTRGPFYWTGSIRESWPFPYVLKAGKGEAKQPCPVIITFPPTRLSPTIVKSFGLKVFANLAIGCLQETLYDTCLRYNVPCFHSPWVTWVSVPVEVSESQGQNIWNFIVPDAQEYTWVSDFDKKRQNAYVWKCWPGGRGTFFLANTPLLWLPSLQWGLLTDIPAGWFLLLHYSSHTAS